MAITNGTQAPIRFLIDEQMFRRLVAGDIARTQTAQGQPAETILADIGWVKMIEAIADAMDEAIIDPIQP